MRRTLETAYHIFKEHPNIKNMRVVVEPKAREKIMIGSDAPCWNSYEMIKKEYVPLFQDLGIDLDLSRIKEACASTSETEPEKFDESSVPWFYHTVDKYY